MIIFNVVTSFTDDVFNTLYEGSSAHLDSGTYPWRLNPHITTEEQKKQHLKALFNQAPIMFTVYEDEQPLMLSAGKITDGVFKWYLALLGPDINGSKSWLYRDDYLQALSSFWSTQNITAWYAETLGPGTSVHDYLINARNAGMIPGTFTTEDTDYGLIRKTDVKFEI